MSDIFKLKKRLKSIKAIEQSSKALQIITSAKIKAMQNLLKSFQEYKNELEQILALVPRSAIFNTVPAKATNSCVIVPVTSNRGFCGGFNHNVTAQTEELIKKLRSQGQNPKLYLIGKKGIQHFKNYKAEIIGLDVKLAEKPDAKGTLRLISYFLKQIAEGKICDVYLVFNQFVSIIIQKTAAIKLLPFDQTTLQQTASKEKIIFDPDAKKVAQEAFLHYLSVSFLAKLVGSTVGELGSRLLITKNAVDTSKDLINQLTLDINKIRQAQITGELSEIISSFKILKEAEG